MNANTLKYAGWVIAILFCLTSCGARKSQVNKSKVETEKTVTDETKVSTKEQIKETVTTTIDTTIHVPEKQTEVSKPLLEIVDGKPMVYENANIKSETYYDKATGLLKNKTTRKEQNIPVKAKEVTDRVIERDVVEQRDIQTKENSVTESKVKETDRKESFSWIWWVVIAAVGLYITWKVFKKSNPIV